MLKRENIRKVTFIVLLIIIWSIFAFNTDNADYSVYLNHYKYTQTYGLSQRFEIGYSLSMLLGAKLGLKFQQFIMVYSAVGMILIGCTLYQYCNYPCLALILYFFYPFFFDVVQIRNFMATAIVFWGLRFLQKKSMRNIIMYIITVLISMTFHITSIFCFTYLLVYVKDLKRIMRITVGLMLAGIIVYLYMPVSIYNILAELVSTEYIEGGSTFEKVIGYGLFVVVAMCLAYISFLSEKKSSRPVDDQYNFRNIIPIMIFSIIAIFFSSQGYRMFRNMSLIIYVAFLNDGAEKTGIIIRGKNYQMLNTIYAFAFSLFFFIRQLSWWGPNYENVTKMILENNLLFK